MSDWHDDESVYRLNDDNERRVVPDDDDEETAKVPSSGAQSTYGSIDHKTSAKIINADNPRSDATLPPKITADSSMEEVTRHKKELSALTLGAGDWAEESLQRAFSSSSSIPPSKVTAPTEGKTISTAGTASTTALVPASTAASCTSGEMATPPQRSPP